jgi:hypothetical protein
MSRSALLYNPLFYLKLQQVFSGRKRFFQQGIVETKMQEYINIKRTKERRMHEINYKTRVVNADRSSKFFLIASVVYLIGVVVSLLGLVKVALG